MTTGGLAMFNPFVRPAFLLALCLLLVGCSTRQVRPEGAWIAERKAWFEAHPSWRIDGRVGLSDGQRAGSLSFVWQADHDSHFIHLRTSAGGRQWKLSFSGQHAELEGSEVGHISAHRPEPLLERALGWPIPAGTLVWWVRGLLPPGKLQHEFSDDGTLARVSDGVWTLDYQRFKEVGELLMPVRLEAKSGDYRIRIVVREWKFGDEFG